MRRSILTRTLGLLTAILYLALPGSVLASRACPHHDGPIAALTETGVAGDASSHGAHGHASVPASDADASNTDCHDCTCIGACSTSSVVVLGAVATIVMATSEPIPAVISIIETEQPRVLLEPFLLPYANAPPQSIA